MDSECRKTRGGRGGGGGKTDQLHTRGRFDRSRLRNVRAMF